MHGNRNKKLEAKKATQVENLPVKVLKDSVYVIAQILTDIFNKEVIRQHIFPSNLKLADIAPIFKKIDRVYKKNYRPVSILPTISKVFERILKNQMEEKVNTFLSPFLCGYRKDFSVEYALVYMVEKWKKALD